MKETENTIRFRWMLIARENARRGLLSPRHFITRCHRDGDDYSFFIFGEYSENFTLDDICSVISDFSIRRERSRFRCARAPALAQLYILQYYLYVLYTPFPSHVLLNHPPFQLSSLLSRGTTSMLFTRCFSLILNLSVGLAKSFQSALA